MHKTVFMWFGNLPTSMELQGYHYYQVRIQRTTTCGYNIFSLYITWQPHYTKKNPNYKRRFHNGLNGPKGPSRSAHGQASVNLPLKTTQYYLGRVAKLDQIELGSIKPNSYAIKDLSLNCLVELKGTFQSLSCLLFNLVTDFIVFSQACLVFLIDILLDIISSLQILWKMFWCQFFHKK